LKPPEKLTTPKANMKSITRNLFLLAFSLILLNCASTKTPKDGSSIDNAIKVHSVGEEYQIVRKLCPECTLIGQGLIPKGNKHYDVLELTKRNGEKVSYYFDINSFYGKW
jgi:hypothetical protein